MWNSMSYRLDSQSYAFDWTCHYSFKPLADAFHSSFGTCTTVISLQWELESKDMMLLIISHDTLFPQYITSIGALMETSFKLSDERGAWAGLTFLLSSVIRLHDNIGESSSKFKHEPAKCRLCQLPFLGTASNYILNRQMTVKGLHSILGSSFLINPSN